MRLLKRRGQQGVSVVEAAASLSLLLPLTITLLLVVLESSYAYLIKNSLSDGAREAARSLAIAYGQNPAIADDRSMQNSQVFDHVRITNMINNSQQFDDPVFDTGGSPATVTVNLRYTSGQYGLPPFPNPDPLNLGNNFRISAQAVYRLE
jgi:Flp pilus assembly protein TadG